MYGISDDQEISMNKALNYDHCSLHWNSVALNSFYSLGFLSFCRHTNQINQRLIEVFWIGKAA